MEHPALRLSTVLCLAALPPAGLASTDPNFNAGGGGTDTVTYQVDLGANGGQYRAEVEICCQAVTPAEAAYLTEAGTTEADRFVSGSMWIATAARW